MTMFDKRVAEKVDETLRNCFTETVKEIFGTNPKSKKIADIQVGKPVYHNGLTFVVSHKNGTTKLSDGTTYDFLTSIKKYLLTV